MVNRTFMRIAAKVSKGPILLKNSQNWTSDFSAKYTFLPKLSVDCRERLQRDTTGLGTLLLPGPSPKYFRCAVRGDIFEFWSKPEFFNRISPLYQMPFRSISHEQKIQPVATGPKRTFTKMRHAALRLPENGPSIRCS